MLKLGVLLEACGIKSSEDQASKLESFVNFWLKKYYIPKNDHKNIVSKSTGTDQTSQLLTTIDFPLTSIKAVQTIIVPTQLQNVEQKEVIGTEMEVETSEKENDQDTLLENEEPEEMVDFPKFYKTKNLSCPICSIKCSFEELIMHVKTCIEIQVENWQKTNYGQCKKCKFCYKHFFRQALAKHMNSCKGNKFKVKFVDKPKKLSNQGDNEKKLDQPEKQLIEHSYSGDKISTESDPLEIEVEETQEPIKIQDVKTETEIEVLKQSENLEPSSESKIEAGNELKGTPDLLEQAVSQIKIHPVEIKPTMEETEMLEPGTDSELKNILPVGLQCKLCQAKFMSNKETQQQFSINSITMKHFLKKHPDEGFDESKFEELRLSKTIMEPHKPYQKFKYHCYLCTQTKNHPIFRKHFKLCHPDETFDKTKVVKTLEKVQDIPIKEVRKPKSVRMILPSTGDFQCPECVLSFPTENLKGMHLLMIHHCQVPESERANIEFVCPICKDKYKQNRILPHLQYCEFQADEIAKGCPHCEKIFKTEYKTKSDITNNYRNLLNHIKMHENESKNPQTEVDLDVKFPFACDNCEKRFTSKESLRNHLKKIHQIEHSAVCNTCGRIFKNHQELRIHWKSEGKDHTGKYEHKCPECNKSFLTHKKLVTHVVSHKYSRISVVCEICDKTFTKNSIKNHKAVMHGKMHLQCQYCPKRFSMKHNLEHHIKDRHIKPHKCNICDKGFGSEWMLEKHKNVTHLGLKPHVCNLCHEGFGELNKLNRHKQLYHSKDRPFQCSKCSKTFNSTTQLEHHIARVHELRNCETCPHCGKIYSRLKAHLLTCNVRGLDRVAHECPGCERKFLDRQNFKKHLEKCEGEGNFSRNSDGNIDQYVLKRTRRR